MKKTIFITISIILLSTAGVLAQSSYVGIRFNYGSKLISIAEGSYVHQFKNRPTQLALDASGGFGVYTVPGVKYVSSNFSITGSYQWIFPFSSTKENGFSWFIGPAISLGVYGSDYGSNFDGFVFTSMGGLHTGINYDFNIPLQIGIDTRPLFGGSKLGGFNSNWDVGLTLRYRIGR